MAQLAKAMPPVCRALTREVTTPPDTPALTTLTTFLNATVDSLVRSSPRDNGAGKPSAAPAKQRRHRLTESFASAHDHWLYTLRAAEGALAGDAAVGL